MSVWLSLLVLSPTRQSQQSYTFIYLLHVGPVLLDELHSGQVGAVYQSTSFLIDYLRCSLTVRFLKHGVTTLAREVKGDLANSLVHPKLDNLKTLTY